MNSRDKRKEDIRRLNALLAHMLDVYIDLFSFPFGKRAVRKLFLRAGIVVETDADKGIRKLEEAKVSLHEALTAIEELTIVAERNKRDSGDALARLKELEDNRQSVELQLEQVKKLASSNITEFRQIAGLPSPAEIRKERYIGFTSGVVASLFASGLIAAGIYIFNLYA